MDADPKAAIVRQLQQQAAISNARQLISVNPPPPQRFPSLSHVHPNRDPNHFLFLEDEQPLLRKVHPVARQLIIIQRGKMFHDVYGKVYRGVEHS